MATRSSDIRELLGAEPTCELPAPLGVLDVAEGCRRATLAFLVTFAPAEPAEESDDDAPSSKRALGEWLAGPYRALTSYVERAAPIAPSAPLARARKPVREARVAELTSYARGYVLGVVREIATAQDAAFSCAAIHDGWIERCRDATGRPGWVPVDRPHMRLTERVLSLLAVDYLVRPGEWLDGSVLQRLSPPGSRVRIRDVG